MMLYMYIYYCTLRGLRAARFCDSASASRYAHFFASVREWRAVNANVSLKFL